MENNIFNKNKSIFLSLVVFANVIIWFFPVYQKITIDLAKHIAMFIFCIYVPFHATYIIHQLLKNTNRLKETLKENPPSNFFFSDVGAEKSYKILVDNYQLQRSQIEFPSYDGIKTQKIDDDLLIFTKDFRTIRLNKDEVSNFYNALIESDYAYFKPGTHNIELKIKTTKKEK